MPTMLTKPYETYERPAIVQNYPLGNAPTYRGALAGLNSSGKVAPLTPAAAMKFLGVAAESGDPAKSPRIVLNKSGSFVFRVAAGWTVAPTDLGRVVYAASDWEVQPTTAGLTNAIPVGVIVGFETTSSGESGVRVRIDLHVF